MAAVWIQRPFQSKDLGFAVIFEGGADGDEQLPSLLFSPVLSDAQSFRRPGAPMKPPAGVPHVCLCRRQSAAAAPPDGDL